MAFFLREYIGPATPPALLFVPAGFRRGPALDAQRDRGHVPALADIAIVTAGMALNLASRRRTGELPAIRLPPPAAHG
ncbi:hypothetical protein [Burkholderia pyrrocinia]|uniref:hypothetical protein n=1 Tax=Burkholderia pyrrocinia TaxID=60550 RepID=UPI0030CC34CA